MEKKRDVITFKVLLTEYLTEESLEMQRFFVYFTQSIKGTTQTNK